MKLAIHKSTAFTPNHILIRVHPVTWLFDHPFGAVLDIYEGGNIYKVSFDIYGCGKKKNGKNYS